MPRLTARYAAALRKYLEQGPGGSLKPARGLGEQAVTFGLETLDVTRMHQAALTTLPPGSGDGMAKRAEIFFSEAVIPIEKTHGAAVKADAQLDHANKRLEQRTADLAASRLSLKKSVARRKIVEEALKTSGQHSKKLLAESQRLQKYLRHLTHRILLAQEDKRKKISRELQDEIGQVLLAINVRLLALRKDATSRAKGFRKEIASTQKLVVKAEERIQRFAREIRKRYEA
jgi:signal transduction histidine kinase